MSGDGVRIHTFRVVGSNFCWGTWGAIGGSVPCSRATQLWVFKGGQEHRYHTLPSLSVKKACVVFCSLTTRWQYIVKCKGASEYSQRRSHIL